MPGSAEEEFRMMADKIKNEGLKKMKTVTEYDIKRTGGAWLGAARSWMQRNFRNGSDVTWSSDEQLLGFTVTPFRIEELAAVSVAAYINEDARRSGLIHAAEFALKVLDGTHEPIGNRDLAISRLRCALKAIEEGGL